MIKTIKPMFCTFMNEEFYVDFSDKDRPIKANILNSDLTVEVMETSDKEIPYFTIYVTDYCNMNCEYCFNKKGNPLHVEEKPTYNINTLISFFRSLNVREINIRFFGGEPTLKTEWIIECVKLLNLEEIDFHYNIFTNGLILEDAFIIFCVENNFQFFVSVGLEEEEHKGQKHSNIIEENISRLLKYTDNVIGSTVWKVNQESSILRVINKYAGIGLKYISIIMAWGDEYDYEIYKKVKKELEIIAEYYINKIINHESWNIYIHPIISYITGLLNGKSGHFDTCACGKNMAAIATNGKVYPCHCFTPFKEFEIGQIEDRTWNKVFMKYNVENWILCNNCEIRYFCKGKCYFHNYNTNHNLIKPDKFRCLIEKEIITCSGYIIKKIAEHPEEYRTFKMIMRMKNEDNTFH